MPKTKKVKKSIPPKKPTQKKKKSGLVSVFTKIKNRQVLNYFIGSFLIVFGIAYLYLLPSFSHKAPVTPIKIDPKLLSEKKNTQSPVKIIIPKVNIDLPVTESKIVNGYWELSENTASHGEGSANPGEKGNIVVFAHAREGLFYNLKDVKKDDVIYLFTKDKWRTYKVRDITSVFPNQTEVIKSTSTETLTLYTCTGFYDEKRLIIKALPI